MRDYAERHFVEASPKAWRKASAALGRLRARFTDSFVRGDLSAWLQHDDDAPNLTMTIKGSIDDRFFHVAQRRFQNMLRHPHVVLTLRVEHVREHQRELLEEMLERLGRYGERVRVYLDETIRSRIFVDSTRIHLLQIP